MVDIGDLARERSRRSRLECIERGEIDHRRGQPARRGRRGIAQRSDVQALRIGPGQRGIFRPAHPARDGEGFDPDILETERLQPRHRPVTRRCFARGTGQARADLGGEVGHDFPGHSFALRRGSVGRSEAKEERYPGQSRAKELGHWRRVTSSSVTSKPADFTGCTICSWQTGAKGAQCPKEDLPCRLIAEGH